MTAAHKVPLATKTLYGSGAVATGVKDTAFNVFLLFFYTQVAGLPGALAGIAIFVALLLDAISDPLIGYWSDRFTSSWGRRHPFMYFAAIPMGVSFFFLFNPPSDAGPQFLFAWMLVFAVLVRFFMTFYAVPSSALIAEMTSNYDERTSLSGYRVLLGWFGGLAFATIGYVVFFAPSEAFEDGRLDPGAYQDFALLGASLIVTAILLCAIGTHHLIPQLKKAASDAARSEGLRKDFSNMLRNRPFMILVAIIFVSASAFGFTEVIGLYMFTYFWGLSTTDLAGLTLVAFLGTLSAFILAPWLSQRYDKGPIAFMAIVILMVTYPSFIGMRFLGFLPENGDPNLMIALSINAVITVFAAVTMAILFVSMIADTIDKNELTTGQRQEAIYTSAYTFSMKATSGLGGLMAGIALQLIRFPQNVEASDVPQATLDGLGMIVAVIIIVFWFVALMILRFYPLTRQSHAAILDQLANRAATK
ncbi:MAG: MFS transporter [Henriciella sp.]|nr:MFS transporter [Henriciella sp.]